MPSIGQQELREEPGLVSWSAYGREGIAREYPQASYYRARYYSQSTGRFFSEDPLKFKAGINFYSYVHNDPANRDDPTGLYALKGFSPIQALDMWNAIQRITDKLNSDPCCVTDPGLRKKLLGYLSGGNNGSGVTFVYHSSLPVGCGAVGDWTDRTHIVNLGRWLSNRVEIAAWDWPGCSCLPATIIHELTHLTRQDFLNPGADLPDKVERSCFGSNSKCN